MLDNLKLVANQDYNLNKIPEEFIEEAILIRLVEEKFLELFSLGLMNGTVHTCVGQEFSAVAVAGQLEDGDWVTSNHRCHGHFISKTKRWEALIDELRGLNSGVCRGIGSSQHLYSKGFLSNGPQGALLPVAAGISLRLKKSVNKKIAVSYIGEGTLGEGIVYETMNFSSLFQLPHLIVCENNFYSQSTPQKNGVSGDILLRAKAFSIKTFEANTWDVDGLIRVSREAIDHVRSGRPGFLLIKTYRLNPHSKGDDNRPKNEIEFFREIDPINKFLKIQKWAEFSGRTKKMIDEHISSSNTSNTLSYAEYSKDQLPRNVSSRFVPVINPEIRLANALNIAYECTLKNGAIHLGEDVEDPYGGAFKITKGLSSKFPDRVINTPISESCIVGVGIGLSMLGVHSFIEIMFGDFGTHIYDQMISNASKFHHMYGMQVNVPIKVRLPMGGKRGYGPTHSQSLEKFFLGIDNVTVIAITSLVDPMEDIIKTEKLSSPIIFIENKVDYGRHLFQPDDDFSIDRECTDFGATRISPKKGKASITIVSYGGMAREIAENLKRIFIETDYIPELICLSKISPLDSNLVLKSARRTQNIAVIEDGSCGHGFGSEILSQILESKIAVNIALRVGADPVPIPSIAKLEIEVLATVEKLIRAINQCNSEELDV